MLKISQKLEYAMRAMVELAIRRDADPQALVPARALAEAQQIPLRFLEQQLGALHKAGLVESFRGGGGGCRRCAAHGRAGGRLGGLVPEREDRSLKAEGQSQVSRTATVAPSPPSFGPPGRFEAT